MATNNDLPFDPLASYSRLSERVENQGRDIVDLRSNMNTGFQTVNANLSALSHEFRSGSKTQWPVLLTAVGVAFTILVAAGSQALSPIRESVSEAKAQISELAKSGVTRDELTDRANRTAEDRKRMEDALTDLRQHTTPLESWQERNRARDTELADINRRVDELRADVGAVYGTRDVIQDMKKEIDALRARIIRINPSSP